jgi:Domain of unknown function (DUF4294)
MLKHSQLLDRLLILPSNNTVSAMLKWLNLCLFVSITLSAIGQVKELPSYNYDAKVLTAESDSIFHIVLPEILIYPQRKDWSRKALHQYTILEMRVLKVYPIAKVAAMKLKEYNSVYVTFKSDRERKDYVKKIEKDLYSEFESEIRTMSIAQGRILIKLIDRETGQSSYEIIKEFKGGFSAFFWQGIARLFGHNLKSEYDAANEDKMIEYIVWQIDQGLL